METENNNPAGIVLAGQQMPVAGYVEGPAEIKLS
jgi:hypothetical protein